MTYQKQAQYLEVTLTNLSTGEKTETKVCPLPEPGISCCLTLDPSHMVEITLPMVDQKSNVEI
jgi:hypothetical protein